MQRIVLSSLFVSAKERYLASRVRSYEGAQSTTSSWGLPGDGSAAIEWFAGVGTLAHAYAHRCARVAVLCEQSSAKQRINAALHPDAALTLDADSPFPIPDEPIIHFSAGLPCQPVAPSGACRAEHDHRAPLVTDSVPNAILQLQEEGKLIFLDIEEHADFVTTGSVMLESLRANLMSLPTPIFLSDPEFFNPATVSGPITRRRCAIRGEPLHVIDRIGSVPPLQPMRVRKRIRDIALPTADVRDDQYVEGTLTLIHHTVNPFAPTIAGSLLCGGEHRPVVVGSRVRIDDDIVTHVVMSFDGNDHVNLFHDDRKEPWFLRHVAVTRITSRMTHSYPVLSMDGFAASCTRVGVPPLGSAKQLWLRDGRAYRPDWRELARLMEIEPVMFDPLHDDESLAENDSIDAIVGDMLSMRMADAMADRSITRSLQYATANNLDDWVASTGDDTTETRAAAHFRPIAYMHNLDIAVALIDVLDGALRVLVSADLLQLPVVEHTCDSTSRDSVVKIAEQFVGSEICDSGDRRLHGFLVYSTSALTVVAFPLGDARAPSVDTSFSSWASLRDVAMSPLYVPLAPALARIAAHCQGGLPTAHAIPVSDGARPSTPIVSLPYSPNTSPSAWPDQLRLLEMYDAQLRRALDAVPSTHPHKMYLTTWIDQVDTAPNADIPFNLRGVSPAVFDDPILVDTPFAAPMPTPSLPPPSFPAAQITSYRPTSLYHILKPGSITKLARALDTIAESLTFMRNGIELPVRLRRTLSTTVIGQDGFIPEARGIVWDLRSKPDGYFRPLDFAAPIPTHLNTDAYFDAIGDDYPDQSLRHQVRRGALFFADVDLQIVICPHLLSLADGFKNVDRELRRLHALGYVEFNEHEEHAFASQRIRSSRASDSDKVIVALGVIPCRCTPQGTRARKLEPDRPRRISDCGAPRKAVFDSASRPVVPLNDAIGFKTALPNGEQKFPTEHKPRLLHAMQDCAVLQSAARVWREPLLQFNDDTKDCFNQFYLHPSQIWMTSVLWLKLTWVASSCPYTHVLEHVFGYGIGCASGFAQRFGNSLMHLVAQRMDALDAPFLAADAANDPSRAAWLRRRQALAARTGRNEARLYALHIYTDDPEFMCVGYDRFIRLLSCWRDVTSMIGLRMAIAEKRQAGSSILWQGLRLHGTYGAAVIPPAKRKRAVKDLSSIALGNPLRLDEAQSIAGLLEHLLPWAGELRSAMYHFYYPHRAFAALGPQHQFLPTDAMRAQSKRWITRLNERPGISVLAHVIPTHTPGACGSVLVMSSDAAKTGTPTPGIGGYMHGTAWHLPLEPSDVVGPYEIPINVLEFIGVFGNFSAFAPDVPECSSVLALTDSLTSALVVSRHSARAPLMQLVHMRLLSLPQFERIAARTQMAHVYGPANAIADAISRGYFDTLSEIMAQLRVALTWIEPTAATIKLLADVRSAVRSFTDPVFRSLSDTASLPVTQNPQRPAKRGKAYSSDEEGDGPYGSRSADQGASSPRPSPPLPSRSRLLAPQRPPRPWSTPPQHPTPAPSPRLQQGPPLPDRRMHPRPQAPTTRADFAWARNPPPPPPAYTSANVTRPERDSSLLHVLANDSSRFRLCPHDPGMLTALVRDVHSTPDLAVPRTTAAKDRSAWRKWVAFCRLLGTPEWRDCHDAHGGADADGRRRECFVQAAFLLWAYRTMTPRNRSHKLPKPASARACLDAVCRVHRHNDINMCPAPSITRLVHGLLTEYVRIHGPECLIPNRREPLTNEMTAAILAIGTIREIIGPPRSPVTRTDLTRVGHRFVDWETPFWASFAALLTTLRHTGARKADLLSYDDDDFDHSSMTRANLKWRISGSTYSSPLPIALRDLQRGDCAIIVPGCTKSDPFALHFGDKPMYLPYLPNDPTNAAARLASLEICCSVPATSRRRYPLFCADDVTRPLTHAQADNTFNSLATKALGPAVATTVSLHSGRVWLACALHANRVSPPTIQAMCRWLSPDSIRTYAHMEPAEYESYILAAIGAPITSRLAQHLPIIDADACVAHLTDSLDDLADDSLPRPRRPALSRLTNTPPPRSSDAARRSLAFDAADEDESESECEVEASGLCDAGRLIDDENIVRGAAVAVPFRLSGTEVHFAGTITRRSDRDVNGVAQYEVRFPDGETWEVRRDRLFTAVELGSRALPR